MVADSVMTSKRCFANLLSKTPNSIKLFCLLFGASYAPDNEAYKQVICWWHGSKNNNNLRQQYFLSSLYSKQLLLELQEDHEGKKLFIIIIMWWIEQERNFCWLGN